MFGEKFNGSDLLYTVRASELVTPLASDFVVTFKQIMGSYQRLINHTVFTGSLRTMVSASS